MKRALRDDTRPVVAGRAGRVRRGLALALVLPLLALGCQRRQTAATPDVVALKRPMLPADPGDVVWAQAPPHVAPLLLQDMVEPRLLSPSTSELRVRAISDGSRIAFRLDWKDGSLDDKPGAARFSDACAVQLPRGSGPDLPAPQMGEPGRAVEITYWRAAWQATVDGRPDRIQELYPGATVDHYPFEAASLEKGSPAQREAEKRYAPARALGNPMSVPRTSPVEDLVAEGPGSLAPGEPLGSEARGRHGADGWSVLIVRRLPPGLRPGAPTQVAFAVWEGSHEEAGARKMRTGWIPLVLEAAR